MNVDVLLEKSFIPDALIRTGIRYLLKKRLGDEKAKRVNGWQKYQKDLFEELGQSPIALYTRQANQQHYEVPASFFETVLGPRLKYSSGFWYDDTVSLKEAEENMLNLTLFRAGIQNGQHVLDLGCGWGSFTLFAAEQFPGSHFTAVSNSATQKQFIDEQARRRKLTNISVITADINHFNPAQKFDRVVSVEMFEHVRNYKELFKNIHRWMKPEAKLFVHIFAHRKYAYKFEAESDNDWMARHFFSGGMMPSRDMLSFFSDGFSLKKRWDINGRHYTRTLDAWLLAMDENKKTVMSIFDETYGGQAKKFRAYWRIFFMACAETFAFKGGDEWGVSHYLFQKAD